LQERERSNDEAAVQSDVVVNVHRFLTFENIFGRLGAKWLYYIAEKCQ